MKTDLRLPPLYGFINIGTTPSPLDFLQNLLQSGVRMVQLRAKDTADEDLLRLTRAALMLCRKEEFVKETPGGPQRPLLIVNDRPEICCQCGADGVHVGQEDYQVEKTRQIVGPEAIVGLSATTPEQARSAPRAIIDYVGFGPIFPSKTKSGHAPATGIETLALAARQSPVPVVAIGGITAENVHDVYGAGAASAAVINDLETAADLAQKVRDYYRIYEEVQGN